MGYTAGGGGSTIPAGVDDAELGYLDGVTSALQTQLDAKASVTYVDAGLATKAPSSHGHSGADLTSGTVPVARLPSGVQHAQNLTSDAQAQLNAKASTTHNHAAADVTSGRFVTARNSLWLTNLVAPWRLEFVSSSQIKLAKLHGRYSCGAGSDNYADFFSAEPTLAPTGLSANTLYNIYAAFPGSPGGSLSIYASTTAPAYTQTGFLADGENQTCPLVGAVYVASGPSFADQATWRGVCSFFNPRLVYMSAFGADQANLAADDAWKTPSTDMRLRAIKHPFLGVEYWAQVYLLHDSSAEEVRAGIDIGLFGTPNDGDFDVGNRPTGSTNHHSPLKPTAYSAPTGYFELLDTRVRVWGDNDGSTDTFDVIKGASNVLKARLWR